ncbi:MULTISPECIES: hypothetical protein [Mycolicibacterium]|jgi:hypothetical protein|uniref:hypothetical protein n=1 Tax=Mycolicibacterium TaxID=1866885 RepID=UPI00055E9C85|nr:MULTISPECIES: hypothetical protein [Mycolicibacterium]QZY45075.1 hypothetical protein K5L12_23080 [Mycolicibacterium austroafricanum]UJL28867.1 hypothetical protein HZU38_29470 [Mycolicibacterium vanbaalenii]WND55581.1 hypothetical protein QQA43_23070 [Mycolicibacterium vanbaalenii]
MSAEYCYYSRGAAVRVALPGDPRNRQEGRVVRSYNDGGDMVHVVEFDGGERNEYTTEELRAVTGNRWEG